MTRIVGRVVGPTGLPATGWVRLRMEQPLSTAAVPGGMVVVAGDRTVALDADGRVDVEVLVPPGISLEVQVGLAGTLAVTRTGVVLPESGTVTLEWVLGLVDSPEPPPGPGVGIVISPDGLTYTQPAVLDGEAYFVTDLAVLSEDGLIYNIKTTGGVAP